MSSSRLFGTILLVGVALVTRAPLLTGGYGVDDDAWLLARSADTLAGEGRYVPSRLPGYPVAEGWFASWFVVFGSKPIVGNLAAAVASLVAALALAGAARKSGVRHDWIPGAVLLLHPACWVNSVSTMDFMVGVALLSLALERHVAGHDATASVLVGLAAGARITHALFILPLLVCAMRGDRPVRNTLRWAAAGGVAGLAVYAPLLLQSGLGFLRFDTPVHRDYVTGAYRLYEAVLGAPLFVALLFVVAGILSRGDRRNRALEWATRRLTVFCLASAALALLPWMLLPSDPFYVIGALPFLCLAIATLPWPSLSSVLGLAAVIPAFAGVLLLDVNAWRRDHRVVVVPLRAGAVARDRADRLENLWRGAELTRRHLPAGSCIIAGAAIWPFQQCRGVAPRHFAEEITLPTDDVLMVRLLRPETLHRMAGRRPIYYIGGEDLPYLTQRILGYDLRSVGARPLPTP